MTTLPIRQSPGCLRCETLPTPLSGPGNLHLRFPLSHSRAKILHSLRDGNWQWSEQDELLSIRCEEKDLTPLLQTLLDALTTTEQTDVRVVFEPDGRALTARDYFDIEPLHQFAARAQSGWLLNLMDNHHLTTFFQPIVSCKNREIFAYECLLRGVEDDKLIPPGRILDVARGSGLLFQLDRMARFTAIQQAARWKIDRTIFINFTPTSIYDPVNCLRSTLQEIDELGINHSHIVFEVIETESIGDVGHLNNILKYYRDNGFCVALDDLGAGYSSLNLLNLLRPDYVKLDRDLISGVTQDSFKAMIAAKLLEAANELGLKTVAEGVETAEEWEWLVEHGAHYAQGYYLAKPGAPPPQLNAVT